MTPCARLEDSFAPGGASAAAIHVITPADDVYPPALRVIADPPRALYVRGALRPADAVAVAIVGARRPSAYGTAVARWLARDLARSGVTIISGLARGIDAAAHQGALDAGGRTIAVLGCGPDVVYPREHHQLMHDVIAGGAVISEYPPGAPPLAGQFPQRNRIISGLALGVVVVEGRERSGALITADAALEQGREVFAVPGNIFEEASRAPHRLIAQGARLVERADDVLDELGLVRPDRGRAPAPGLQGVEAAVYARLSLTPQHLDDLASACGRPVAEVSAAAVALECKDLAVALPGHRYVKRIRE